MHFCTGAGAWRRRSAFHQSIPTALFAVNLYRAARKVSHDIIIASPSPLSHGVGCAMCCPGFGACFGVSGHTRIPTWLLFAYVWMSSRVVLGCVMRSFPLPVPSVVRHRPYVPCVVPGCSMRSFGRWVWGRCGYRRGAQRVVRFECYYMWPCGAFVMCPAETTDGFSDKASPQMRAEPESHFM